MSWKDDREFMPEAAIRSDINLFREKSGHFDKWCLTLWQPWTQVIYASCNNNNFWMHTDKWEVEV